MNNLSPEAAALFDLPADACLWPIDDNWCGRPAMDGCSYCPQHRQESRAKVQHDPSPLTVKRWLRQIGVQIEREQRATFWPTHNGVKFRIWAAFHSLLVNWVPDEKW